MTPLVSVIIVTYNSASCLRPTLEALFGQSYTHVEAILVDNASRDGSLAMAREYETRGLKVIASPENRGFGGGNNDGVAASKGEIILLLNPDAVLAPDGIERIVAAFAEKPEMGILGAKLVAEDGETLLHCGGWVDPCAHSELYGRGEKDTGKYEAPRQVEFVAGALLAIRRPLWDRLHGFDETFHPAYYEDTDLCVRANRLGAAVWYWPIRVIHKENVSLPYKTDAFLRIHHRNRLWFQARNRSWFKLLFWAAPHELAWLASWHSKGCRKLCMRLYGETLRRKLTTPPWGASG